MKTLSTILTLPVLEMLSGKVVSNVKDAVMNPDTREVVLVMEETTFADLYVIRRQDAEGIGNDYITVKTRGAVQDVETNPGLVESLREYFSIIGLTVITSGGSIVGKISDFSINESDWTIAEIVLDNGATYDAAKMISVSHKYIFVQDTGEREAAEEIKKQEPEAEEKDGEKYLEGMTLKEDIADESGQFVIRKGTVLTAELVEESKRRNLLSELIMNVSD